MYRNHAWKILEGKIFGESDERCTIHLSSPISTSIVEGLQTDLPKFMPFASCLVSICQIPPLPPSKFFHLLAFKHNLMFKKHRSVSKSCHVYGIVSHIHILFTLRTFIVCFNSQQIQCCDSI